MKLPVGVSNFKELIKEKYLFADKTLFIKDIMNDGSKVILITRPRRFGKTLNLSMLYYFLRRNHSGSENLFEGLNISKDEEFCKAHQHQYPVIFISFKDIKKSDYSSAYADIVFLIKELYAEHRYLLEGDVLYEDEKNTFMALLNEQATQTHLKVAIKKLSEYLARKFGQAPIILMDEYDTPIQSAYLNKYYEEMIGLMRDIFGQALKDNSNLKKGILTGITRVAQESLFSGVNNLEVYSVLEEYYGQYFGFTEEEVLKLIADTGQTLPIAPIKEWYNGYQIGRYTLYNPWSILGCLKNSGKLEWYWANTSSNDLIRELLSDAGDATKLQFEKLLQGEVIERPISKNLVFPNIRTQEAALWSLLLYAGYLKVLSTKTAGFEMLAELAIPNQEVAFVYSEIIAGWFSIEANMDTYKSFIGGLINGNVNEFKKQLAKYIIQTGSFFDFNEKTPETVFHVFMLGLVVGLKEEYVIQSNRESGLGRLDVVFIPKDRKRNGILIEFKISESPELCLNKAQEALEQIKDKQYIETFRQHDIDSVLAIGLAFCGKQMELVQEDIAID